MIKFLGIKKLYSWHDLSGHKHLLSAASLAEAKRMLLQQQKYFFKVTHIGYISHRSFTRQELILVTKQLATMLRAGLPIIECLTILAEQHHLLQWQLLLSQLKRRIMAGEQISQTLSHYPNIFPSLYKEIIATGELTGQLEQCFDTLAIQLDNNQKLTKKVKQALRYPLFLLSVSIIVTLIMLVVVLPKFADVYQSFNAQLPIFTQLMLDLAKILQDYLILITLSPVIFIVIYYRYLNRRYKDLIDNFTLKLPMIGTLITSSNLTQIFQTLYITQKAGIALLAGLNAAKQTTSNAQFHSSLSQIIELIEQGYSFSQAINHCSIYPRLCFQLIRVGEESGTLEMMLNRLAQNYQQHSLEVADNLSQRIEPALMTVMALIIGSLVIAMYLPVFQLGSVIH